MNTILIVDYGVVLENDVGCVVSNWGPWGPCYSTCGPGHQIRQRSIRDHPYITSARSWLFFGPPTNYVRLNRARRDTILLKILNFLGLGR